MFGPGILDESSQSIVPQTGAQRNVRHCFDFLHIEDTQIGLPLMEPVQRIMIRTEIFRKRVRMNRAIEHSAQGDSIHDGAVNGKADDPSRKLIHDHQNPMAP